jgi:hypothetical protein
MLAKQLHSQDDIVRVVIIEVYVHVVDSVNFCRIDGNLVSRSAI